MFIGYPYRLFLFLYQYQNKTPNRHLWENLNKYAHTYIHLLQIYGLIHFYLTRYMVKYFNHCKQLYYVYYNILIE